MYHKPVLLRESIEGLHLQPGSVCVDLTYGGGGHAKAILERIGNGRLIAFDSDADAARNLPDDDRLTFVNHNFRYLKNFLRFHNAVPVDAILADLGVSSYQFDTAAKGFSTRFNAPLDMRMNRLQTLDAAAIVNTYTTEQLARMFRNYGELSNGRRIAGILTEQRQKKAISSTSQLTDILKPLSSQIQMNKFLARVFQALRIEVNDEMGALRDMLEQSLSVMKEGGRLAVISYHSLEDRMVKNFMKTGNISGSEEKDFYGRPQSPFLLITRKVIIAGEAEISLNSRARSARLRIAEKRSMEDV